MYAILSDQGTAMSEGALCDEDYAVEHHRETALAYASQADDVSEDKSFVDCSGNEYIRCLICGADTFGNIESYDEDEYVGE